MERFSKPDAAGKLHQFYTWRYIKQICGIKGSSPLENKSLFVRTAIPFSKMELKSLEYIGQEGGKEILIFLTLEFKGLDIVEVNDVGVTSGAGTQVITDDIVLAFSNGDEVSFSLKCAKQLGTILSRNMGAKSLLSSYFELEDEQDEFNVEFDIAYLKFLNSILSTSFHKVADAKRLIRNQSSSMGYSKPRFGYFPNSELTRDIFLRTLRDNLYSILRKIKTDKLINASNMILDSGTYHILAEYSSKSIGGSVKLQFIPTQQINDFLGIEIRDNRSVIIKLKSYIVGFRYKFESSIDSSVKLVGDYKKNNN